MSKQNILNSSNRMCLAMLIAAFLASCASGTELERIMRSKTNASGLSGKHDDPKKTDGADDGSAEDTITAPVPVGGAFLVCNKTDKAPARDGMQAIGCYVTVDNERVVVENDPTFTVKNSKGTVQFSYEKSSDASFDWFVYIASTEDTSQIDIAVDVQSDKGRITAGTKPPASSANYSIEVAFDAATTSNKTVFDDSANPINVQMPKEFAVVSNGGMTSTDLSKVWLSFIVYPTGDDYSHTCSYFYSTSTNTFAISEPCKQNNKDVPMPDVFSSIRRIVFSSMQNSAGKSFTVKVDANKK